MVRRLWRAVVGFALALRIATRRGPTGPLLRSVLVVMVVITGFAATVTFLPAFKRPVLENLVFRVVVVALRRRSAVSQPGSAQRSTTPASGR